MFRNSSILNSTSPKQPNQIITRDDPGLKTITNLESSNTSSKFEQINVITFEPQRDQLFSIDGMYKLINFKLLNINIQKQS